MKPSHLATIMLAAVSGGLVGGAHAVPQSAIVIQANRNAVMPKTHVQLIMEQSMRGTFGIESIAASWHKKNQRQIRIANRRKHAAGFENAFAR